MDEMDIRTPDSYKTETLLENSSQDNSCHESQEISCRELELAMLESMEESWAKEAECASRWSVFQPFLERIKRIGYYEQNYRTIYELLSIRLYKYAYDVEDSLSEETYRWIEMHLKKVRITPDEREHLTKAFDYLRSSHSFAEHRTTQLQFAEHSSTRPHFES